MKLTDFPPAFAGYIAFIVFLLGLVFGSFGNAWAWRIVHNERISRGRSHCPDCGHTLGVADLIPLFSWLFLRGRCRYCKKPISKRYPITEAVMAAYFLSVILVCGVSLDALRFILLGFFLFVSSLVDIDKMELPDGLLIAAAVCSLLRLVSDLAAWKDMLLGLILPATLLIIVLIMDKVMKRETMGGGDIKLLAALALHFGLMKTFILLILACVLGLIFALIAKRGKSVAFPFGPMLSLAGWLTVLVGSPIAAWYSSLL